MKPYQPVIIIGAPRSGTNILRDVLTSIDGCATWPCDEINYIWRHGNVRYPTDEFPQELARPDVVRFIRKKFDIIATQKDAQFVIEKTCANSLRVAFIEKVFPEAKFIFLVRDGIDVVHSAIKRWTAPLDIPYLLAKAKFVPISDLPYYFLRYLLNRLHKLISKEKRLSFWGPVIKDMPMLTQQHNLQEICALQWQRCVELSGDAFDKMPSEKWLQIHYENFVKNSEQELKRICDFLDISVDRQEITRAVSNVSDKMVGTGHRAISKHELEKLTNLIGRTLIRYGYR